MRHKWTSLVPTMTPMVYTSTSVKSDHPLEDPCQRWTEN